MYKIAVASTDGEKIDLGFGEAESFRIYEVEGLDYRFLEERNTEFNETEKCDTDSKDGNCSGGGGGCKDGDNPKVSLLDDCRCIVCSKIGAGIQRIFDRKGISAFDVDCTVIEALDKIVSYINRVDDHVRSVVLK